jgi:RNA polymerase sigma-70 factor, ECF subfamily
MGAMVELALEVLEQHHEKAFKWAMSCCHYDHDEAKDIMQSVYIEILNEKAVFREESSLSTWLYTIIHRIAWRRSKKHKAAQDLKGRVDGLTNLMSHACDGSRELAEQQQSDAVIKALANLSTQQRQLIELVYYRDFTVEEAATIIGCRLGTARTHFHRAKLSLARQLQHLKGAILE